jgi:dihydrofolate reductase
VSVDGFGAGPQQDGTHPLGVGGESLHAWFVPTRTFQSMSGRGEGTTGVDDDYARRGMENLGAWILGRNMFGPVRGPWPDESWKGWWGDEPPYHVPVFVLTHYPREPITMRGGTTFHFVTGGIHEAMERARRAAGKRDIRIGGGVATIQQFLQARLIDEVHLAVRPVILGQGEKLFDGLDIRSLGYRASRSQMGERAMHVFLTRESR